MTGPQHSSLLQQIQEELLPTTTQGDAPGAVRSKAAEFQPSPLLRKHLQGSSTCIWVVLQLLNRFGLSLKVYSL